MVFVFHLGLCERGAARNAPVNRFLPAIDKSFLDDVGEQSKFVRLVFLVQREVGILPIAKHAEALELLALNVDVFAGVGVAGLANCGGVHIHRRDSCPARFAHFLGNLEFDGQAVAIPARHIRRAVTAQGLVFDDDVFENLVKRVADVDVAIGEGRAIVQDKFFGTVACDLDFLVEFFLLPLLDLLWFAGDKVGLHREVRPRQVQGVFVVHCHSQGRRTVSAVLKSVNGAAFGVVLQFAISR